MRKILHVDLNAFYASVEQALNPDLEGIPVAVAGDKEKRTGIILTASYEARGFGVKTGMTVGDAKKLCPEIVLVKPNFKNYMTYSIRVMDILRSFSPDVEQFSIDEAWVDVTGCEHLFGNPVEIADKIRYKIKDELNITASVGVSYCKLVAKLASDLKKPDATTVVMKEDLETIIWPLPINDLMGVGRKTRIKLNDIGIFTIGDLANSSLGFIEKRFGKVGRYLWYFANGIDNSKVSTLRETAKGIGNSITTPRDIVTLEEASEVLMVLSESVGKRLREHGLEGDVIEITVRTSDFNTFVRQRKIYHHTDTTYEIHKNALKLLSENWGNENRIRLLGVRVTGLRESSGFKQMSFFEEKIVQKNEVLDRCMDTIRDKYGKNAIVRASMMVNESHKSINIVSDKEWTPMNPFNKGGGNL